MWVLFYLDCFFVTRLTVRCYGPIDVFSQIDVDVDGLVKSFVLAEVKATTLRLQNRIHFFLIHHLSSNNDYQWTSFN